MTDPLQNYNWCNLYEDYDSSCMGFNEGSEYLDCFKPRPQSDRELYYYLVKKIREDRENFGKISLESYKAMLYWKLNSQPIAIANILGKIDKYSESEKQKLEEQVGQLSENLPDKIINNVDNVIELVKFINKFSIRGILIPDSFPVRTTFLHFIYPEVVPIFDKMVLQAVGINNENANHKINILREYIPHAWYLADKYKKEYKKCNFQESGVRIIDMALWVNRGR